MDKKIIDRIVWWIPFRQLRNDIRILLLHIINDNDILKENSIKNNNILKENNINIKKIDKIITKLSSKENIIFNFNLDGIEFYFYDAITSKTVDFVKNEIIPYNLDSIDFKNGDTVIDIGGNVGIISIYLAKKYPFLKIYAFEPVKQNYENFIKNIEINNIPDGIITVENVAITEDRRKINMMININNSGGSRIKNENYNSIDYNVLFNVPSITFDDIFEKYNIENCKLLKIDCEGSEYEILYSANKNNLKKCEYMRGEFHKSKEMQKELYKYVSEYIKNIEYHEV